MVSSFPKRFCKAYLPLIPVFDLGAQLDSIAKFVPQSQTNQEVNKKRLATKKQRIQMKKIKLNVLQKRQNKSEKKFSLWQCRPIRDESAAKVKLLP